MHARVARQIEEFVGRGHAVQHLLVGRVGRLRRTPVLADERLDGRPVDDVERIERAAAGIARIDGRGVDDQQPPGAANSPKTLYFCV
jgi:hypothetical protein